MFQENFFALAFAGLCAAGPLVLLGLGIMSRNKTALEMAEIIPGLSNIFNASGSVKNQRVATTAGLVLIITGIILGVLLLGVLR